MVRKKKPEIEDVNFYAKIVFMLFGIVYYIIGTLICYEGAVIKDKLIVIVGFEAVIVGMIFFTMALFISVVKRDNTMSIVDAIKIKLGCD